MNPLYLFSKAAFGKGVPKSKIYEHATPGSRVKDLFVKEVDKIIWSYKLSSTTSNLPASSSVQKIQIFTMALKTGELSQDVLPMIDNAIPLDE